MVRECSNLACSEAGLFVSTGKECLLLDPQTGETQQTYLPPFPDDGKRRTWAYMAVVGDTLYGSTSPKSQESDSVFAIDIYTGQLKWTRVGRAIRNNTLCVSEGRVLFADNAADTTERRLALQQRLADLVQRKAISEAEAEKELASADVRLAVALDAATGEVLWRRPLDLTDCGESVLSAIAARGVLVFCGAHANGHFWPQFLKGEYAARRATALDAATGEPLWTKAIGYRIRPLVIGDTLYAEPWAFDLRTGAQKMRANPVTGSQAVFQFERPGHHCGNITGCPNLLAFRSGSMAYYDLLGDFGVTHFAGQRPGCWVNMIPCNGLLVAPEASSGCVCAYSIHCTTVFKPRTQSKAWGIFSSPGETLPVRHLAIDVGAPGDRRGSDGELWLSYPRPGGRMRLDFALAVANLPGGGFFSEAPEHRPIEGSPDPWLFASGIRGVTQCRLPLLREGDGAALYTVRLAFADPENQQPGQRVFDIKLQGNVVAKGFDIVREAGGPSRAVERAFTDVRVDKDLLVEFVPSSPTAPLTGTPILHALAVERTKVLSAGLVVPSLVLNDAETERVAELKITNSRDEPLEGTLQLQAPPGLMVTPAESPVKLGPQESATVPVKVSVGRQGAPAALELRARLLLADGTVDAERSTKVEYLGPRVRVVVPVLEDAYVNHGQPEHNFGPTASLLVDGGDQVIGDASHNLSYLRFRVSIPGRSTSVKLRLHTAASPASESGDSGVVCLCEGGWTEGTITYGTRPEPGREVGKLGRVGNDVWEERALDLTVEGDQEVPLVLVPTSTDGASYHPREGQYAPELVIEYEPKA
jgi:hypothetical protein